MRCNCPPALRPGLHSVAAPRLFRVLILITVLLAINASCKVGPKYHVPVTPMTPNFKEPPPAGWKEAQPQDDCIRGNWWEMFGDAQLNSLEEQVDISNQTIAAAEANFRAARATITVARADLFPTITVGAITNASQSPSARSVNATGTSTGTGKFYQLPIDLTYELDIWGKVRNNIAANVANTQASSADVETVRLSTHAELGFDYFALRGLDEQARLLDATILSYQQALQLTQTRFDQGVASGLDVALAKEQLDTTIAQRTDVGVTR